MAEDYLYYEIIYVSVKCYPWWGTARRQDTFPNHDKFDDGKSSAALPGPGYPGFGFGLGFGIQTVGGWRRFPFKRCIQLGRHSGNAIFDRPYRTNDWIYGAECTLAGPVCIRF